MTLSILPDEMPKDLGRVHAAFEAALEAAPEALLRRILVSRAAGERRIVPAAHAPRRRSGLIRSVIAAGLVFAALAAWSLLSHREKGPAALSEGDLFDFGLVTPALARTTDKPKYPAIKFDVSRLHAIRLTYNYRVLKNGVVGSDHLSLAYTLEPTGSERPGWRLITQQFQAGHADRGGPIWTRFLDTLQIDPVALAPVELVSRIEAGDDGKWRRNRFEIGDTVTTLHSTRHGLFISADLKRPETYDSTFPITLDRFPRIVGHGQWMVDLMAAPLGLGWKGSAVQLIVGGVLESAVPLDFAVVGEEQVDTPMGRQDCWKLAGPHFGNTGARTILVRKRDGVLIRERWERKEGRDTLDQDFVLVQEQ